MSTKASFLYQLKEHKKPLAIYYIVILCVYALMFIGNASVSNGSQEISVSTKLSGLDMATVIFLFVAGLNSFKENFRMLLQNSVTRKSVLLGRILASLAVCALMAAADRALILLFKGAASLFAGNISVHSLIEDLYPAAAGGPGAPAMHASGFLLDMTLNISAAAAGYMISLLFYRLNKAGKALVDAGVPILFFVVLPALDKSGAIFLWIGRAIYTAYGLTAGRPVNAMLTGIALFIAYSLASGWMIARAAVRD